MRQTGIPRSRDTSRGSVTGNLQFGGERTGYEFYTFDSRTDAEQRADYARGGPQDPLVVVRPRADTLRPTWSRIVLSAGVAWMVNIDPSAGGDPAHRRSGSLRRRLGQKWAETGKPAPIARHHPVRLVSRRGRGPPHSPGPHPGSRRHVPHGIDRTVSCQQVRTNGRRALTQGWGRVLARPPRGG